MHTRVSNIILLTLFLVLIRETKIKPQTTCEKIRKRRKHFFFVASTQVSLLSHRYRMNDHHLSRYLTLTGLPSLPGSDNRIPVCSGDELFSGEPGKCKCCGNVTRGVFRPTEITRHHQILTNITSFLAAGEKYYTFHLSESLSIQSWRLHKRIHCLFHHQKK